MKAIITLIAGICLAWSAVLGYWAQDRALPVNSRFVEIVGPTRPGGRLLVRWSVNRLRACSADKSELIIDSNLERWILPVWHFPGPPGPLGRSTYVSQSELPADIPLGPAKLWVTISYICNPLQSLWPVVDTLLPIDVVFTKG